MQSQQSLSSARSRPSVKLLHMSALGDSQPPSFAMQQWYGFKLTHYRHLLNRDKSPAFAGMRPPKTAGLASLQLMQIRPVLHIRHLRRQHRDFGAAHFGVGVVEALAVNPAGGV